MLCVRPLFSPLLSLHAMSVLVGRVFSQGNIIIRPHMHRSPITYWRSVFLHCNVNFWLKCKYATQARIQKFRLGAGPWQGVRGSSGCRPRVSSGRRPREGRVWGGVLVLTETNETETYPHIDSISGEASYKPPPESVLSGPVRDSATIIQRSSVIGHITAMTTANNNDRIQHRTSCLRPAEKLNEGVRMQTHGADSRSPTTGRQQASINVLCRLKKSICTRDCSSIA